MRCRTSKRQFVRRDPDNSRVLGDDHCSALRRGPAGAVLGKLAIEAGLPRRFRARRTRPAGTSPIQPPGGSGGWTRAPTGCSSSSGKASTSRRSVPRSTSRWRKDLDLGDFVLDVKVRSTDARLRSSRPLPGFRPPGSQPFLLRPPGEGGRRACQQHLPCEREAPRDDRRITYQGHSLDRRLAQCPPGPAPRRRPDPGLLRRHGTPGDGRARQDVHPRPGGPRLVRRYGYVRRTSGPRRTACGHGKTVNSRSALRSDQCPVSS